MTTSSNYQLAMDENIAYDQLPVMSPMMASNSNESGNGGQSMIDDGKLSTIIKQAVLHSAL